MPTEVVNIKGVGANQIKIDNTTTTIQFSGLKTGDKSGVRTDPLSANSQLPTLNNPIH
jgi:hypothetical protein